MRITINGFGEAYFIFHLDTTSPTILPIDGTSIMLEFPEKHLVQVPKHPELRMFLNMLPTESTTSTARSSICYSVTGKKEVIRIFKSLLNADFMLNTENIEFVQDALINLRDLELRADTEALFDKACRWHLQLLRYILIKHDYSVYGGGIYVEELAKALSTHAADAYQKHIKPFLAQNAPITQEQFSAFSEQISLLIKPTNPPEAKSPQNSTLFTKLTMRSNSTTALYHEFLIAHKTCKESLKQFHYKLTNSLASINARTYLPSSVNADRPAAASVAEQNLAALAINEQGSELVSVVSALPDPSTDAAGLANPAPINSYYQTP